MLLTAGIPLMSSALNSSSTELESWPEEIWSQILTYVKPAAATIDTSTSLSKISSATILAHTQYHALRLVCKLLNRIFLTYPQLVTELLVRRSAPFPPSLSAQLKASIDSLCIDTDEAFTTALLCKTISLHTELKKITVVVPTTRHVTSLAAMTSITSCSLYLLQDKPGPGRYTIELDALSGLTGLCDITIHSGAISCLSLPPAVTCLCFLNCTIGRVSQKANFAALLKLVLDESRMLGRDAIHCTALTHPKFVRSDACLGISRKQRHQQWALFDKGITQLSSLHHLSIGHDGPGATKHIWPGGAFSLASLRYGSVLTNLCSLDLQLSNAPILPDHDLHCMCYLTHLSLRFEVYIHEHGDASDWSEACSRTHMEVQWAKLWALQSVCISGPVVLTRTVLQLCMLPQLRDMCIDNLTAWGPASDQAVKVLLLYSSP